MAIYAKITGSKTGAFTGDVKPAPFTGQIFILSSGFGLSRPTDSVTMLAAGRAVARPLTITKPLDKTSPLFFNAATTNESLTVILNYTFDGAPTTASKKVATIQLKNAMIQEFWHAAGSDGNAVETVSLGYEEIEITWMDGGITALFSVSAAG